MTDPSSATASTCPVCGGPLTPDGSAPRVNRLYCSPACRRRASRRSAAGRPIADPPPTGGSCARCYGPLTTDGAAPRPGRRFCSAKCRRTASWRSQHGLPVGDRLVSADELTAEVNRLTGQLDTLQAELSAALGRAARADSFLADADRTAREAADTVSAHAGTVMRRTERADSLAAELSALTVQLNTAYRQIQTVTSERDQATAKVTVLSKRVARQRTPSGQAVRTPLTVAAQTYAYVIQLANAYRDYANQYGGMNETEWQLMKDLPKYRENVKENTLNLDTYTMYLLTLYTQRFLNIQKQGRKAPDFLPEVVSWRNKLNALFTLPVKLPVRKTYKFPATFPKKGANS